MHDMDYVRAKMLRMARLKNEIGDGAVGAAGECAGHVAGNDTEGRVRMGERHNTYEWVSEVQAPLLSVRLEKSAVQVDNTWQEYTFTVGCTAEEGARVGGQRCGHTVVWEARRVGGHDQDDVRLG